MNCGKAKDSSLVANRASETLSEFRNSIQAISPQPPISTSRSSLVWIAPPPDLLKINTSVAFHMNSMRIRLGVAI